MSLATVPRNLSFLLRALVSLKLQSSADVLESSRRGSRLHLCNQLQLHRDPTNHHRILRSTYGISSSTPHSMKITHQDLLLTSHRSFLPSRVQQPPLKISTVDGAALPVGEICKNPSLASPSPCWDAQRNMGLGLTAIKSTNSEAQSSSSVFLKPISEHLLLYISLSTTDLLLK